jgi:predicted lipoprotein
LDNKINYPLSFAAPGIPQIAESPFADASMANLLTNIETFEVVFSANHGFGLDDILIQQGYQQLSTDITTALIKVKASARLLPNSFTKTIAEEPSRRSLEQLVLSLRDLQLLIVDMVDKLNLNLGFNSLDGD